MTVAQDEFSSAFSTAFDAEPDVPTGPPDPPLSNDCYLNNFTAQALREFIACKEAQQASSD